MSQIHTLSDIGEGKKLGDMPANRYPSGRTELENQLVCANHGRKIAIECDNKRIQHDLKQSNKDKEKLSKHVYQLINEVKRLKVNNTNLTSQITRSQISRNEYKVRYDIQLKEIKSHQAMIKILEGKLASAQKDAFSIQESLSKTESENLFLKSKMVEFKQIEVELEHVRSELDHLKSEAISKPVGAEPHCFAIDPLDYNSKNHLMTCSAIVGGDDKKNTQSEEQSSITKSSNSLRPYLACRKNIEDIEKINDDDRVILIPKVSDSQSGDANVSETNNSETSKDIMLDTHINSDPQISVGGIEAIPIVASGLMSPLSAYILLILLFIADIWFIVLRHKWGICKKSERYTMPNWGFWHKTLCLTIKIRIFCYRLKF
ncbi:hypothetical protein Glove_115g108 [Diversispora epigaea]|uniref:Uncharacterized protein n=1 Tax=Diversispora epigaea TaxID=1348612 RepID=A0A397J5K0_9GLOM|nr:hypothetical protein Glove_115g108 [Diversispora epigaea]